ncbi:MAG TPA: head GIN domain-containing protein [Usitatibacter sp.]|jgi:hypothetical protein|nr:head GIN domain-containing protein [Usitatibacter sp.]
MTLRFALAACILAAAHAQAADIRGSGRPATEKRDVTGIHGVAISLPGDLDVRQGGPEGVTVTADDNVLPYIETVVENGVLRVRTKPDTSVSLRTRLHVQVVARSIEELDLSGAGNIDARQVDVPRLTLRVSGAGDATLAGRARALDARISGSGHVNAVKLATEDASVRVSGSAHVRLDARKTLAASISGVGDVEYYGDPKVERRISGTGRIERAGAAPG